MVSGKSLEKFLAKGIVNRENNKINLGKVVTPNPIHFCIFSRRILQPQLAFPYTLSS